jgi:hypothetical protein
VTAGGAGFTVSGSHTFAEEGNYFASVAVTDAGGAHTSITGTLAVADALLFGQLMTVGTLTEGAPSGNIALAAFTDPDTGGTASDYAATITWGDGNTSTGAVTATASGFVVSGSTTYSEEGTFPLSVKIADAGGSTTVLTGAVSVANAPLSVSTLTLKSGTPALNEIASVAFSDADPGAIPSDYAASVDWGDSTTTTGTVAAAKSGFTATASHTYAAKGTYTVTVTISDGAGPTIVTASKSATVKT